MKRILLSAFCLASTWMSSLVHAQDLHFSQYYNAPMLLNPANTGLLQDKDWRAGLQYRNQGGTIPVPYNTFSAFADFGLLRNKWETSWLGAGLAVWRDVAGNGNLALTKLLVLRNFIFLFLFVFQFVSCQNVQFEETLQTAFEKAKKRKQTCFHRILQF